MYAFFCSVHSLWRVRHISMSIALEPATSFFSAWTACGSKIVGYVWVCVYHGLPPVTSVNGTARASKGLSGRFLTTSEVRTMWPSRGYGVSISQSPSNFETYGIGARISWSSSSHVDDIRFCVLTKTSAISFRFAISSSVSAASASWAPSASGMVVRGRGSES